MFKQIVRLIITTERACAGFCQAEAQVQEAAARTLDVPSSSSSTLNGVITILSQSTGAAKFLPALSKTSQCH
jgi:hypothetical protein